MVKKLKKSQEEIDFENDCIEIQRYENTKRPDEELDTWRKRMLHEDKMTLMYNMAMMYENNPNAQEAYNTALARYNFLKDSYENQSYQ